MVSPFDPSTWWRWSTRPAPDRGWLDTWLEVTTWWIEPTRSAIERAKEADPRVVLVDLVEGISRRFESQRLETTVRSTAISGVLDSMRLVRGTGVDARIDLSDVRVDDVQIDKVSALVPSLALQLTDEVRLSASASTVQLSVAIAELVRWLQPRLPGEWSARVDDAGDVWARRAARAVELMIEPVAHADSVDVAVRAIRIGGRVVRLPRWLRVDRSFTLQLPEGMRLVGAFRAGSHVEATVEMPPLSEHIDLAQLRDAVSRRNPFAIG